MGKNKKKPCEIPNVEKILTEKNKNIGHAEPFDCAS